MSCLNPQDNGLLLQLKERINTNKTGQSVKLCITIIFGKTIPKIVHIHEGPIVRIIVLQLSWIHLQIVQIRLQFKMTSN